MEVSSKRKPAVLSVCIFLRVEIQRGGHARFRSMPGSCTCSDGRHLTKTKRARCKEGEMRTKRDRDEPRQNERDVKRER